MNWSSIPSRLYPTLTPFGWWYTTRFPLLCSTPSRFPLTPLFLRLFTPSFFSFFLASSSSLLSCSSAFDPFPFLLLLIPSLSIPFHLYPVFITFFISTPNTPTQVLPPPLAHARFPYTPLGFSFSPLLFAPACFDLSPRKMRIRLTFEYLPARRIFVFDMENQGPSQNHFTYVIDYSDMYHGGNEFIGLFRKEKNMIARGQC